MEQRQSFWSWFSWLPIRRSAQVLFAEAFGQALQAGIPISEAITLAAEVNPSPRFRAALIDMARQVRTGETLEAGLLITGVRGTEGLLVALQVGEDHECLAEELFAFARRFDPQVKNRLNRRLGRSKEAIQFAAALARFLRSHPLTVEAIENAGRLAASGNKAFQAVVAEIREAINDGYSFAEALQRHPAYFDLLYCRFVQSASGRAAMCAVLEELGQSKVYA